MIAVRKFSIVAFIFFAGLFSFNLLFAQGLFRERSHVEFNYCLYDLPGDTISTNQIMILFSVPYDNLLFEKQGDSFYSSVIWTVTLTGKPNSVVFTKDLTDSVQVSSFKETLALNKFFSHNLSVTLKPGEYTVTIRLHDKISNAHTLRSGKFIAKDFNKYPVNVSDLIILKKITGAVLNPGNIWPRFMPVTADSVFLYADVTSPKIQKTVSLSLEIQSLNGQTIHKQKTELTLTGWKTPFARSLNISGLSDGRYKLKLSVLNIKSSPGYQYLWVRKKMKSILKGNLAAILEPMQYIMNHSDWIRLKHAAGEKRKKLFQEFWQKRNPLPNSKTNPLLEEFHRRVQSADEDFSYSKTPGWKTDRGRIYIIYGPPDDIYTNNTNIFSSVPPYIIWTYYDLRLKFVFVDELNTGDFRLVSRETF